MKRLLHERAQVRIPFLVLLVLGAALLHPAAARADAPPSLDEYRRAVERALAFTEQANALAPAERAPLLNQAAAALENIRVVQLPGGAETPINNTALVAQLRDADKIEVSLARLSALRAALTRPPASIHARDLDVLRELLSRPPFASDTAPPWLEELLSRILAFFDRLFNTTARGVYDVRDLFVLGGVLAVIAVTIYFVLNLRRNLVAEEELPAPAGERDAQTPAEAFSQAQRFIAAGDYRRAVRQLYLATLLILDQHGKLKYDPTLTNREYLQQASNDPRTTAALEPIVETFDRAWYGYETITAEEFDAFRQRVEEVRHL